MIACVISTGIPELIWDKGGKLVPHVAEAGAEVVEGVETDPETLPEVVPGETETELEVGALATVEDVVLETDEDVVLALVTDEDVELEAWRFIIAAWFMREALEPTAAKRREKVSSLIANVEAKE